MRAGRAASGLSASESAWMGMLSKSVAMAATYPLSTIKTKMQAKQTTQPPGSPPAIPAALAPRPLASVPPMPPPRAPPSWASSCHPVPPPEAPAASRPAASRLVERVSRLEGRCRAEGVRLDVCGRRARKLGCVVEQTQPPAQPPAQPPGCGEARWADLPPRAQGAPKRGAVGAFVTCAVEIVRSSGPAALYRGIWCTPDPFCLSARTMGTHPILGVSSSTHQKKKTDHRPAVAPGRRW